MYELKWTVEEMAAYAREQAATIKQKKCDQIIGEMEVAMRRAAHKGEMRLKLTREMFWDDDAHRRSQYDPNFESEYYDQEDYAEWFRARGGYRIIHSEGDTYLSWEPKPVVMDE